MTAAQPRTRHHAGHCEKKDEHTRLFCSFAQKWMRGQGGQKVSKAVKSFDKVQSAEDSIKCHYFLLKNF